MKTRLANEADQRDAFVSGVGRSLTRARRVAE